MSTEVWFRNPDNYVRELVECGSHWIAWDRGLLVKKRIDPLKHASLYFGQAMPWRLLMVGEQGTAEYRNGDELHTPTAVYPTWRYGDEASLLEEIVSLPVGRDPELCSDKSVKIDERPVLGQEHRVVIIEPPNAASGPGRQFLRYLKELQESYPDCIIHIHGLYGWNVAFGMGFRAADIDPRTPAQKGKVIVPAGREMKFEQVQRHPQWCTVLGFKPVDLAIPRNRCMYNIKSAEWAGKHYTELTSFKSKGSNAGVDIDTPEKDYLPAQTKSHTVGKTVAKEGDQMLCNTCSLQLDCKYYREGAVCSVPGAEPEPLARFFKTRDSDQIIDGLNTLLATQTRRLEQGVREEEEWGELNPEVTKILNGLFDRGVTLAKLLDPSLRSGPKVGVFVGPGGNAQIANGDPRKMVGAVIRELEEQGVPRDKITPDLVQSVLAGQIDPDRRAIQGRVIPHEQPDEQAS